MGACRAPPADAHSVARTRSTLWLGLGAERSHRSRVVGRLGPHSGAVSDTSNYHGCIALGPRHQYHMDLPQSFVRGKGWWSLLVIFN